MTEPTLQELITRSKNLRDEAKEYDRLAAQAKSERDEIDVLIIALLDAQGVDSTRTDVATVSVSTTSHPNVDDWDAFTDFVVANHAVYLLQRRVSAKAVEELIANGDTVPGISFFTKKTLNLRSR